MDWGALNEDAVRLVRAMLVVLTGREPPGARTNPTDRPPDGDGGVKAMTVLASRADGHSPARTCARSGAGGLLHAA